MFKIINYQSNKVEKLLNTAYKLIKDKYAELLNKTDSVNAIKRKISQEADASKINYQTEALIFNQAFYFKNLYKCLIALLFLQEQGINAEKQVTDLGCGAGVFTMAYSLIFNLEKVNLFDLSVDQLEITKKIFSGKHYNYWQRDFNEISLIDTKLTLCSHCLCEQNFFKTDFGNKVIVIDYPFVIKKFIQANFYNYVMFCYKLNYTLSEFGAQLIGQKQDEVHLCYAVKAYPGQEDIFTEASGAGRK